MAAKMIDCPSCHHHGIGIVFSPGSPMMEGLLWLLIFPGIMYTIWRRSNRRVICPNCSTEFMLPSIF